MSSSSSLLSTPVRAAADRQPFPASAQPSPAASLRQTASTSMSGTFPNLPPSASSQSQASQKALTVDGLLRQHEGSPNPTAAALEQAVNDRNILSAQNTQLWKLIEKQRAGYNQILKELERIRGERDSYKAKLGLSNGAPAPTTTSNPRQKTTSERGARPSLDLPSSSTNSPVSVVPLSIQTRQQMHRHNSDETATTSRHQPLHSSRSYDPIGGGRPSVDSTFQSNGARPASPSRQAPPQSAPTPSSSRPHPTPLNVPSRIDDLSSTISNSPDSTFSKQSQFADQNSGTNNRPLPATNGTRPLIHPRKASLADSVNSFNTSHSSASVSSPPTSVASHQQPYYPSPPAEYRPPINIQASSQFSPTTPTASQQLPPPRMLVVVPDARPNVLSRDSRISLPDEARQYIANMSDSPVASPHTEAFSPKSRLGTSVFPPQAPATTTTATDSSQDSEFLDMDEEDSEDDSDAEGAGNITAGAKDPGFDSLQMQQQQQQQASHHERDNATYHQAAAPPPSSQLPYQSNSSREEIDPSKRQDRSRAGIGAEEFPLPPPSQQFQRGQQLSPQDSPQYYGQHNPSQQSLSSSMHSSSSLAGPASSPVRHPDAYTQQQQQPEPPGPVQSVPAAFRALPLLSSDLPQTVVNVSHSFVRPNDRGKEVLSFIVFVNPGNGKEGWKVEKMYSDVLSLDQRVRNSVGKGVGKKIANLPEGKLWRDHAPAKVDQRKAVLENYLQTLIRLPVKNNDEVVAFFTSDIVREQKQPVMQAGHKEGYLTKRGKNFGGWKTRFFVLQGPVLEYYDCRGGAHLGSIAITGAQIARQHRTEKPPSTDDEKEYRHAFLIVESKKGPGGNHPRHVLCAESDEDRDSWVEMLVRYYTGTYSEDLVLNSVQSNSVFSPPRSSTSSESPAGPRTKPVSSRPPAEIARAPPPPQEEYTRSASPSRSLDPSPDAQKWMMLMGKPSSLPDPSPLAAVTPQQQQQQDPGVRANSEIGHYPDLQQSQTPNRNHRQTSLDQHRPREDGRKSLHPSAAPPPPPPGSGSSLMAPPPDRAPSPEAKVKISGPMNGAPIPSGFKFGGKEPPSAESAQAANDRREKAKSRSFWGFGKDKQAHATYVPRAVFGVPLEEALDISQIANLPSIVFRAIQYLEAKKADQEEGIYRLSGSSAVIKSLKDMFNNEGDVDLLASDEYWDPHAIAGLLKSYLRELPSSILTRELHLRFLAVIDFVDPQERIRELSQLIAALPLANYSLLRALTAHLILIVQNSNVNKMTMRNVGIVFSPTLGIPAGVFSLMLGEFNRVFNVDNLDLNAEDAREEEMDMDTDAQGVVRPRERKGLTDHSSDPLRRNSRQYIDTSADQLLGLVGRTLSTPAEETQSDGDDFSIQEESGTEATDDLTGESSSSSPAGIRITVPEHLDRDSISTSSGKPAAGTKAANMAATKGLNVAVTTSDRGNRHSRMIGLPSSPRPQGSPSRGDGMTLSPPGPPAV